MGEREVVGANRLKHCSNTWIGVLKSLKEDGMETERRWRKRTRGGEDPEERRQKQFPSNNPKTSHREWAARSPVKH